MTAARVALLVALGCLVGVIEWMLFNVIPASSVVKMSLIVSSLLIVRQRFATGLLFGGAVQVVYDIGSYMLFPLHTIAFLLCCMVVMAMFRHVVVHRALAGYVLGGAVMIFGFRVCVAVLMGLVNGVNIPVILLRFPSVWVEGVVSLMVYVVIVGMLYHRFKVLRVDWPRAA